MCFVTGGLVSVPGQATAAATRLCPPARAGARGAGSSLGGTAPAAGGPGGSPLLTGGPGTSPSATSTGLQPLPATAPLRPGAPV